MVAVSRQHVLRVLAYPAVGGLSFGGRGESSEMRLRFGDSAVSRDIEAQFREQGIRPGGPVTLNYADGTTHTGRWMDRTDGSRITGLTAGALRAI